MSRGVLSPDSDPASIFLLLCTTRGTATTTTTATAIRPMTNGAVPEYGDEGECGLEFDALDSMVIVTGELSTVDPNSVAFTMSNASPVMLPATKVTVPPEPLILPIAVLVSVHEYVTPEEHENVTFAFPSHVEMAVKFAIPPT